MKTVPHIVLSFLATNAGAIKALPLFMSVNTLMRHIGPIALQAACLSGEQGQQGERRPADDCSVLHSAQLPFNHLPFSNFSCRSLGRITSANSPLFHQYSVIFSLTVGSLCDKFRSHDIPYCLTVWIPWERANGLRRYYVKRAAEYVLLDGRYVNTTRATTTHSSFFHYRKDLIRLCGIWTNNNNTCVLTHD